MAPGPGMAWEKRQQLRGPRSQVSVPPPLHLDYECPPKAGQGPRGEPCVASALQTGGENQGGRSVVLSLHRRRDC